MPTDKTSHSVSKKTVVLSLTLLTLALGIVACNRDLPPDPVKKQDGVAVIPFDGTVWVIPEKTWLKGYSRSVDGTVSNISLHAKAPEIAPWSEALHKTMYPEVGWGEITWIDLSKRDTDWPVPDLKDTELRCFNQTGGRRWSSEESSARSSRPRPCGWFANEV